MKKGTLIKTLISPRWKHCVSPIQKGTEVEYTEEANGRIIVKHPNQQVSILVEKKNEYINI